jgi:hypothetical protein
LFCRLPRFWGVSGDSKNTIENKIEKSMSGGGGGGATKIQCQLFLIFLITFGLAFFGKGSLKNII